MTSKQNWQIGIATHTGPIKKINEDDYFIQTIEDAAGNELTMVAVADGMGGYKHGDTASKMAITLVEQWWERNIKKFLKKKNCLHRLINEMNQLFKKINEQLLQYGTKIGTTLSILMLYKGDYAICHVGDSRIYQFKGGYVGFQNFFRTLSEREGIEQLKKQNTETLETDVEIVQLTEDHSWVEQQVKRGKLTKEEARNHRKRNVLTQCLGIEKGINPWGQMGAYQSSDLFLLCTDGFYSMFSNDEIAETILGLEKEYTNLQTLADYLVNLANYTGTKDNITVILLRNIFDKEIDNQSHDKFSFLSFLNHKRWS